MVMKTTTETETPAGPLQKACFETHAMKIHLELQVTSENMDKFVKS